MGRSIRMSDKALAWWEAQPEQQTCSDCGKEGSKAYVQPQPAGGALCTDCICRRNERAAEVRKRQLAALPRCEACGRHRGNFRVGRARVLLCGRCKRKAERSFNRGAAALGGMALFMEGPPTHTREAVLSLVKEGGQR